ncbi:MAG TPA: M56 family metallopeptidase, partial [Gemmataceae bacterium]|nr:M56 family metallopeptidase [Gemmataceae bacterium]
GRFRPAVRHALWLVVLLKLATPPVFTWPGVSLILEDPAEAPAQAPSPSEPEPTYQILVPVQHDSIVSLAAPEAPAAFASGAVEPPGEAASRASPPSEGRWRLPAWLGPAALRVVLIGAALLALVHGIRIVRFRRLLAAGRPAPAPLTNEVAELAAHLGVRTPDVRQLPELDSPLVCGLGRPLLLWPEGLRLPAECQRAVICHELAHLRRRDHWVAWLRAVAGCWWWWNPLYWYVSRQLGRNAELACDAWVIAALPDARRDYAEALLAVAGRRSRTAALAPALGMSGSRRDFERRLVMVMRDSVPCKTPVLGLVAIGVLALGVLPGLSLSQQAEKPKKIVEKQQPAQTETTPVPVQVNEVNYVVDFVDSGTVVYQPLAAQPSGDDRDRKIKELEDKLQALLKEVKSLRETKITPQTAPKPKTDDKPANVQPRAVEARTFTWAQSQPLVATFTLEGQQHAVTLSRATYKMPKDMAESLAAFLKHAKGSVVETKIEDDTIVVTTTPNMQQTIGQLVGLMTGKPHGATNLYKLAPTTTTAPANAEQKKP